VIGGAAAVMLRTGGTDETPPIITADSSPTKVEPDNTGAGDSEGQAKLIYDRVDPGSEVAGSELVVPGDDPIADIPPIPEDTGGNDVSRVILEGGPGPETPAGDTDPIDLSEGRETAVAGSGPPEPEPIGPKKVRTVVVRPDGTIVSSAATATGTAETIPICRRRRDASGSGGESASRRRLRRRGDRQSDPDTPAGDVARRGPDVPAPARLRRHLLGPPPPQLLRRRSRRPWLRPPAVPTASTSPRQDGARIGRQRRRLRCRCPRSARRAAMSTFRDLRRRASSATEAQHPARDLGERGVCTVYA
jgi:hypothetical protein